NDAGISVRCTALSGTRTYVVRATMAGDSAVIGRRGRPLAPPGTTKTPASSVVTSGWPATRIVTPAIGVPDSASTARPATATSPTAAGGSGAGEGSSGADRLSPHAAPRARAVQTTSPHARRTRADVLMAGTFPNGRAAVSGSRRCARVVRPTDSSAR